MVFIVRMLASAAVILGTPGVAAQIVVEAEPVAQRLLMVTSADLADGQRLDAVRSRIRQAARSVCTQQYPTQTTYYHARACYSGTVRDALGQLRRIEANGNAGTPVEIAIRPH